MDDEPAEFYARVREEYLAIAAREPERFKVVDAAGSIGEVRELVTGIISTHFA
jgi:dTMP kinase